MALINASIFCVPKNGMRVIKIVLPYRDAHKRSYNHDIIQCEKEVEKLWNKRKKNMCQVVVKTLIKCYHPIFIK